MKLLEAFEHHTSEVARAPAIANGEGLPSYDIGFDSNTSSDEESDMKNTTVFDL